MNIAVVNLLRIGDVFQSIPLIKKLAADLNEDEYLDFYVSNNGLEFLENEISGLRIFFLPINKSIEEIRNNDFNNQFLPKLCFIYKLNINSYDHVFNLNSLKLSTLISGYLCSKRGKIHGYTANLNDSIIYNYYHATSFQKKNSIINISEFYLYFSNIFGKKSEDEKHIDHYLNSESDIIGIIIDTGDKIRELPVEFYVQIVKILSKHYKIELFGLKEDKAEKICSLGDSPSITNFVGRTTLAELSIKLKKLKLLISPDTGIIHLAAILGVPIVGLFNISAYYPLTAPFSNECLIFYPKLNCYPCEESYQPCGNLFCKRLFTEKAANIGEEICNFISGKKVKKIEHIGMTSSSIYNDKIFWKSLSDNEFSDFQNLILFTKMCLYHEFSYELNDCDLFWHEIIRIIQKFKNDKIFLKKSITDYLEKNNRYSHLSVLLI